MSEPEFAVVKTPQELDECLALRKEVFVGEQGVSLEEERDGADGECTHFLVRLNGKAVGAARVRYFPDYAKIQRVCIVKDMRGSRLGADLIRFILRFLKEEAMRETAYLESQVHAIGFYEKLGFRAFGKEFMDAGIPHRKMTKAVKG